MKNFKIPVTVLKDLVNRLAPFSNGKNAVSFVIGFMPGGDGKVPSTATIVDGGNQISVGITVLADDDEKYAFAVKADEFLGIASALLAYDEVIEVNVSETTAMLRAGAHAELPLALLAEAEQPLPCDESKSFVALLLETGKFLSFARKGCYLFDSSDTRNIADRVVIKLDLTGDGEMTGFSTDTFAFATAKMSLEPTDKDKHPNGYRVLGYFYANELRKKAMSLPEEEQKVLMARIDEALASDDKTMTPLMNLCKEQGITIDKLDFSLLYNSFELLKKVIKGTTVFQLAVTDMHVIILTQNCTAAFTLGSTVPTIYDGLFSILKQKPQAEVVIDTQALNNGLSLMLLNKAIRDMKASVFVEASNDGLVLSHGGSKTKADYVAKAGAVGATDIHISAPLLKKVVSSMDNGNLYMAIYGPKNPIFVRNGALDTENHTCSCLLPVNPETAV